jgi:hypothetical protein
MEWVVKGEEVLYVGAFESLSPWYDIDEINSFAWYRNKKSNNPTL